MKISKYKISIYSKQLITFLLEKNSGLFEKLNSASPKLTYGENAFLSQHHARPQNRRTIPIPTHQPTCYFYVDTADLCAEKVTEIALCSHQMNEYSCIILRTCWRPNTLELVKICSTPCWDVCRLRGILCLVYFMVLFLVVVVVSC